MKKNIFIVFVTLLFSGTVARAQLLSTEERTYLVDLLEANSKRFLADIENISDEQWRFKAAANTWSVGEVSEHIALSESLLYSIVQKTLLSPADQQKAQSLEGRESQLLISVMDRSSKAQAPEVLKPAGKYPTKKELIEAFKTARQQTIDYVKTSNDPLKHCVARHPVFGELTAYQWLVFIAGHANRHVAQLEEVKGNTNFPKI